MNLSGPGIDVKLKEKEKKEERLFFFLPRGVVPKRS